VIGRRRLRNLELKHLSSDRRTWRVALELAVKKDELRTTSIARRRWNRSLTSLVGKRKRSNGLLELRIQLRVLRLSFLDVLSELLDETEARIELRWIDDVE
jgi:hypothetical protein